MAKKPEVKKKVEVLTKEQVSDFPDMPAYLQRIIDNIPQGGDNSVVYAGGYGWVCEYQNGNKELLEELPGLLNTLKAHGRDKFGRPFQPGDVLSTDITVSILNMMSEVDLQLLASTLGIEGDQVIPQLIEKLQIK